MSYEDRGSTKLLVEMSETCNCLRSECITILIIGWQFLQLRLALVEITFDKYVNT